MLVAVAPALKQEPHAVPRLRCNGIVPSVSYDPIPGRAGVPS